MLHSGKKGDAEEEPPILFPYVRIPCKKLSGANTPAYFCAPSATKKKNVLWRFRQVSAELQAAQESADRYKKLEAEFQKVVDRDDQFCKNLIRWQSYKTLRP